MLSRGTKGNNSAKKKHKPSYRPKIRWELFGLPNSEPRTPTIEVIRSEVSTLAVARLAREPIPQPKSKPALKPSMRKRS
jgi:hypothetical protein